MPWWVARRLGQRRSLDGQKARPEAVCRALQNLPVGKYRGGDLHVRNMIVLVMLSVFGHGCSERAGQPRLEPPARGLSEAWRPATHE
jgi:hypothetical protein